jgi:predicted nucleic acid-binding protein
MVYLDSSALIKRFIAEKGSAFVDHIVRRHRPITTSRLSYIEIYSCFARLKRQGSLSEKAHASASKQFEREFLRYRRIEWTPELFAIARALLEKHPLRSLDAIQLASAAQLKQVAGDLLIFAGADRRLLDAAAAEGFRIVDVEKDPIRL